MCDSIGCAMAGMQAHARTVSMRAHRSLRAQSLSQEVSSSLYVASEWSAMGCKALMMLPRLDWSGCTPDEGGDGAVYAAGGGTASTRASAGYTVF